MHKLFSQGICGEAQKQTEIGPIPRSWTIARLGDCCKIQTGIAKGRKVSNHEAVTLPYLRVANVQDGLVDLSEMKEITIRRSELGRYSLREGDLVLTEGGDRDKLGRGFIWHGQIATCVIRITSSSCVPIQIGFPPTFWLTKSKALMARRISSLSLTSD